MLVPTPKSLTKLGPELTRFLQPPRVQKLAAGAQRAEAPVGRPQLAPVCGEARNFLILVVTFDDAISRELQKSNFASLDLEQISRDE